MTNAREAIDDRCMVWNFSCDSPAAIVRAGQRSVRRWRVQRIATELPGLLPSSCDLPDMVHFTESVTVDCGSVLHPFVHGRGQGSRTTVDWSPAWRGDLASAPQQRRLSVWLVLHLLAALVALLFAFSGGIGVKDFVFGAMTGSFLTAPLFAWMAMDTMNSDLVAVEHRDGPAMRVLTWFGLAFLTGFSLLFIGWSAFAWGA